MQSGRFLNQLRDYQLLKDDSALRYSVWHYRCAYDPLWETGC